MVPNVSVSEMAHTHTDARTHTQAHMHTLTLVKSRLCKQAHQMNQVLFLVCLLGKLLTSCQSCRLQRDRKRKSDIERESERERESAALFVLLPVCCVLVLFSKDSREKS